MTSPTLSSRRINETSKSEIQQLRCVRKLRISNENGSKGNRYPNWNGNANNLAVTRNENRNAARGNKSTNIHHYSPKWKREI